MRTGVRLAAAALAATLVLLHVDPVLAAAPLGSAPVVVPVGLGTADASTRQVVRTAAGVVYVFAVDLSGVALHTYRSSAPGLPAAFVEVGAASAPTVTAPGALAGVDARIDGNGVVHVAYLRGTGATSVVVAQTFLTVNDTWGPPETVVTSGTAALTGAVAAAIVLDHVGLATVIVGDAGGVQAYRRAADGSWPSDGPPLTTTPAAHVSATADRLDRVHVAWLEDAAVRYAMRTASGWQAAFNAGVGARPVSGDDQGPSIAVDANDQPLIAYATGGGSLAVRALVAPGTFVDDGPKLAIGGRPTALALRNDDRIAIAGHVFGTDPGLITRRDMDVVWSEPASLPLLGLPGAWSGGVSVRFDPVREPDCTIVDAVVADAIGNLAYIGLGLAGSASGTGACVERSTGAEVSPSLAWTTIPTAPVSGAVTIGWSTVGAVADQSCSFDGGPVTACISPFLFTPTLGPHSLRVTVANAAGSYVGTQVWTQVLAAPTLTISGRPNAVSESRDATITFVTGGAGAVTCKLDAALTTGCTSPVTFHQLANGQHTITIRIANPYAGHSETVAWTIAKATTPPTVAITDGPVGLVSGPTFPFVWAATGVVASTSCKIDAGVDVPCSSPDVVSGLSRGPHTLTVRVTNSLGSATDARTWTVGDPPPTIELTATPPPSTTLGSATVGWTSHGIVAATSCTLDDGVAATCSSPLRIDALAVGPHTLTITVAGAAGVGSARVDWNVARTSISFLDQPAPVTAATAATFAWALDGPASTVTCSVDGGPYTACVSPTSVTVLAGDHSFAVRTMSPVGQSDLAVAWTVAAAQLATGQIGIQVTERPAPSSSSTSATIGWTADGGATLFACRIDGGSLAPCVTPLALTRLAIGTHSVELRATTLDATAARVVSWAVVPAAPHVRLLSFPDDPSATRTGAFAWTTSGDVTAVACSLDDAAFAPCASPYASPTMALGRHTLVVRASSGTGALDRAPFTWVVADPMVITVTRAPAATSRSTTALLMWDTSAAASATTCIVDGTDPVACASPFTISSLDAGHHSIVVDVRGSAGESTTSVVFDAVPEGPLVVITRRPVDGVADSARIGWRIDGPVAGEQCRLDGGPWRVCLTPRLVERLAPGLHTFTIHAWSGALESFGTVRWTVWGRAGLRWLSRPPSVGGATAIFRWRTTGKVSSVRCRLDAGHWRACNGQVRFSRLGLGRHVLLVRVVGPAGGTTRRVAWLVA